MASQPPWPADYKELARAVDLSSHGVGIGSFVYLRRLFESQIDDACTLAEEAGTFNSSRFKLSRMDEKITMLRDFLPEFLVEHRQLYGILSKGIHSLSEEECLGAFPIVLAGLELILDEKAAMKKRAEKVALAAKQISALQQKLSTGTDSK